MLRAALVLTAALVLPAALAEGEVLPLLDGRGMGDWEERSFAGRTAYELLLPQGEPVLLARASASASGLYREQAVPIAAWPVLSWSWRADELPGADDERTRAGDDFAARIYVVARDPIFFWRTRAVCYVWSGTSRRGEDWPNPFTENVRMLALRGLGDPVGEWREERRDVAADFRRLFGEAPRQVDAVAIMTDSDQTGGTAGAAYRALRFETPRAGRQGSARGAREGSARGGFGDPAFSRPRP